MGKGDKKTKKGKIIAGSYGVWRPKKKGPAVVAASAKPKTEATDKKKPERKKVPAKKKE